MNCKCANYPPIAFDRKSINKRIRESKEILPTLVLLAENEELWLKLLKCPECGQFWQSGHEWNFKDKEYFFQVPEITVDDWLAEPFAQPAAMMIFTTIMETFCEDNSFEDGTGVCRAEGCNKPAVKLSAFCKQHHIEQLQNVRLLPKRPPGRMFPPYT